MTIAEGLELKELREALQWCSGSSDFSEGGIAREGWLKGPHLALSRDKTSHEQEAQLMEDVVSAAKEEKQNGGYPQRTRDAIEAIDEFRGKTHHAIAKVK